MRKARSTLLFCAVSTLLLLQANAATENSLVLQRADGCLVMEASNAQVDGSRLAFGFELTHPGEYVVQVIYRIEDATANQSATVDVDGKPLRNTLKKAYVIEEGVVSEFEKPAIFTEAGRHTLSLRSTAAPAKVRLAPQGYTKSRIQISSSKYYDAWLDMHQSPKKQAAMARYMRLLGSSQELKWTQTDKALEIDFTGGETSVNGYAVEITFKTERKRDNAANRATAPKYLETGGERKLNVLYKKTPEGDLHLDLYYPTGNRSSRCPVIIYTHGGGWAAGSRQGAAKASFAAVFKQLVAKGFCVASVDYRLWKKDGMVSMRDCVIDSKDAVRYLSQNSESLGIDPMRVYVMGDSAGGQIAQMLLLSSPESLPGDPELAGTSYRMVAGVSWYGPCDFEKTDLFNHDDRADFRDRFAARILKPDSPPEDKLTLYREMSPVNYLTKESPPLLVIQGDKDTTIPVKHAYYMQEKAETLEAPVEILIIRNAGHNWRKVDADINPSRQVIVERTVQFFVDHF